MYKCISAIPSYLVIVAIMVLVGVIASSVIFNVLLPLSVQKGYPGLAIDYTYHIAEGKVVIEVVNKKTYDAKVDVFLITANNKVLTACPSGYVTSTHQNIPESSNEGFTLLGIEVKAREILTIVCFIDNVKDVKVFEYGLQGSAEEVQAYVGTLPSTPEYGSPGFRVGIGEVWGAYGFHYRLPVTVVALQNYDPAYVEVKLSSKTLPADIYEFIKKHVRPDLNDIIIMDVNGRSYPTKATRNLDGSITVIFRVDKLEKGVYRYFLYFGNPELEEPLNPLDEVVINPLTYIRTRLPRYPIAFYSISYPAYLIPEANWLPPDNDLRFGLVVTKSRSKFANYENVIKKGDAESIQKLIAEGLRNIKDFPIGTADAKFGIYRSLKPKTDLGWAPWGAIAVVPLPIIGVLPNGTGIKAVLCIASDDGAGAYVTALTQSKVVFRAEVLNNLRRAHGPSYWNYPFRSVPIDPKAVVGVPTYLLLLVQNGLYSGSGAGYLDFRFVMWYVEQSGEVPPPPTEDFSELYRGYYIDVTVYGIDKTLKNYAFPVDLTGRSDVDWKVFDPETVYVISLTDNEEPLYYWVQVKEGLSGDVVVWVLIPNLPAGGEYKFRIHYGGENKYRSYNNPEVVFSFFDDFTKDPRKSGMWNVYQFAAFPKWDEGNNVFYLIRGARRAGLAMFMKRINDLDSILSGFHTRFKVRVSGTAEGFTFFFFKNERAYKSVPLVGAYPTTDGTLALSAMICGFGRICTVVRSKGFAVEFDIWDNGVKDPPAPHIALVETYSSPNVAVNPHYGTKHESFKDKWLTVDVYYYNKVLTVKVNGREVLTYGGGIFHIYSRIFTGFGFSASTGFASGEFAVDYVLLRKYYGRELTAKVIGYAP